MRLLRRRVILSPPGGLARGQSAASIGNPPLSDLQWYFPRRRRLPPATMTSVTDAIRVLSTSLFMLLTGCILAQTTSSALPQFGDYPAGATFTGTPAAPKLAAPLEQRYANQIREGVAKGYGVFRDGKERKGPNFAGSLIAIQWGCGAPCLRMALVDARTGNVFYPPISINGLGAQSFDLPLLSVGGFVTQNPKLSFRLNSNLIVISATPDLSALQKSYTYYFLWQQDRWKLLRRVPLNH